jgi:hypothetical protein
MIGRLMRCPEYPTPTATVAKRSDGVWTQRLVWEGLKECSAEGWGVDPADAAIDAYERYRAVMWLRWHGWGRA